jgi:hypothetical protein
MISEQASKGALNSQGVNKLRDSNSVILSGDRGKELIELRPNRHVKIHNFRREEIVKISSEALEPFVQFTSPTSTRAAARQFASSTYGFC